ncbi:hypothetical protein BJ742DRAFT_34021 [Cladochytrium replicatum]|nr:hypothetical protein BJ742DRAFT_34021 [Cladochytrium replicatum]
MLSEDTRLTAESIGLFLAADEPAMFSDTEEYLYSFKDFTQHQNQPDDPLSDDRSTQYPFPLSISDFLCPADLDEAALLNDESSTSTSLTLHSDDSPPTLAEDNPFVSRLLGRTFMERNDAIDFAREHARKAGFSILVRTSRQNYAVLVCGCRTRTPSGPYPGSSQESGSTWGGLERRGSTASGLERRGSTASGLERRGSTASLVERRGSVDTSVSDSSGVNRKGSGRRQRRMDTGCRFHLILHRENPEQPWQFRPSRVMEHNHPLPILAIPPALGGSLPSASAGSELTTPTSALFPISTTAGPLSSAFESAFELQRSPAIPIPLFDSNGGITPHFSSSFQFANSVTLPLNSTDYSTTASSSWIPSDPNLTFSSTLTPFSSTPAAATAPELFIKIDDALSAYSFGAFGTSLVSAIPEFTPSHRPSLSIDALSPSTPLSGNPFASSSALFGLQQHPPSLTNVRPEMNNESFPFLSEFERAVSANTALETSEVTSWAPVPPVQLEHYVAETSSVWSLSGRLSLSQHFENGSD